MQPDKHGGQVTFHGVDICRFVCAMLVVAMHIQPFATVVNPLQYWIVKYPARLAVPFFFIASGFFLFRKIPHDAFDARVTLKYARRIFGLYLIWTLIYSPLSIVTTVLDDPKGLLHGCLIYLRNFVFDGSYSHLWYLGATVAGVLALTLLLYCKIKPEKILLLASAAYAIGLLGQSYFGLLEPLRRYTWLWQGLKLAQSVMVTTRNGLFEGLLFLTLGMLLAHGKITLSLKKAGVLFAVSMVLLLGEILLADRMGLSRAGDMYIFLVPAALFLFCLSLQLRCKPGRIYKYLRNASALIYYLHGITRMVVAMGLGLLSVNSFEHPLLNYCAIMVSTILASHIILLLEQKKPFHWLKKLHS